MRHIDSLTLIYLVLGTGTCIHAESRFVSRKEMHKLAPELLAKIIATGISILRCWPGHLQSWAREEAKRLAADQGAYLKLRQSLRRLGHRASVPEAQASLIQNALSDLFGNIQRSFAPPTDTLLRYEASQVLGIAQETLKKLVDIGLLDAEVVADTSNRRIRFKRSTVEDLRTRMERSISIALFSRMTGLPFYAIDNLCLHELLDREADAALHYLRGFDSVTLASVSRLRREILASASSAPPPGEVVPIDTAARRIGGRLKPWTAILEAVRDRTLTTWCDPNSIEDKVWLRSILVRPVDIARFDQVILTLPTGGADRPPEDCSLTDAKYLLNLAGTPSVDLKAVFSDSIAAKPQRGPRVSVSMTSVLQLAESTISIAEVCARTGWNPRQAKWALQPFAGMRTACGWDRSIIEDSGVLQELIEWDRRAARRAPRTL